jgi:hypothetical protein
MNALDTLTDPVFVVEEVPVDVDDGVALGSVNDAVLLAEPLWLDDTELVKVEDVDKE